MKEFWKRKGKPNERNGKSKSLSLLIQNVNQKQTLLGILNK